MNVALYHIKFMDQNLLYLQGGLHGRGREVGYKTALIKYAVVAGALLNDDATVRRPLDRLIPIPGAPFLLFSIRNARLILTCLFI